MGAHHAQGGRPGVPETPRPRGSRLPCVQMGQPRPRAGSAPPRPHGTAGRSAALSAPPRAVPGDVCVAWDAPRTVDSLTLASLWGSLGGNVPKRAGVWTLTAAAQHRQLGTVTVSVHRGWARRGGAATAQGHRQAAGETQTPTAAALPPPEPCHAEAAAGPGHGLRGPPGGSADLTSSATQTLPGKEGCEAQQETPPAGAGRAKPDRTPRALGRSRLRASSSVGGRGTGPCGAGLWRSLDDARRALCHTWFFFPTGGSLGLVCNHRG